MKPSERRFLELQGKAQAAAQADWSYTLTLTTKYGVLDRVCYASPTERRKREVLDRASRRAWDRYFAYLTQISPRDWSSRVPVSWIRDSLTYQDAITAGPLSEVPPAAYGALPAELQAFALPIRVERIGA